LALLQTILAFKHLLGQRPFIVFTDHRALQYLFQSNKELPTLRLRKFYWKLMQFTFKIIYKQPHNIPIADLLSRHPNLTWQKDNPNFICPIAFDEKDLSLNATLLHHSQSEHSDQDNIENSENTKEFNLAVQTRSQTKAISSKSNSVNVTQTNSNQAPNQAQTITQKLHDDDNKSQTSNPTPKTLDNIQNNNVITPNQQQINTKSTNQITDNQQQNPHLTTEQRTNQFPIIGQDNSPSHILHNLPKQHEINPLIKQFITQHYQNITLPYTAAELQTAQQNDLFYKPIIQFYKCNRLPNTVRLQKGFLNLVSNFALIDDLLYHISILNQTKHVQLTLCIPKLYVIPILDHFHATQLGAHQGITKLYLTVKQYFWIQNLYMFCQKYVQSCLTCQRMNYDKNTPLHREYQPRIILEYAPFSVIHTDFKNLPQSTNAYKYCLIVVCQVTRFVIAIPLKDKKAPTVSDALLFHVFLPYAISHTIIMDMDTSFKNQIIACLTDALGIQTHFVLPTGHNSLVAERSIQSISNLLLSLIEYNYNNWPQLIKFAVKAYNISSLAFLDGYTPFYLVFLRNERCPIIKDIQPLSLIAFGYDEYITLLKQRFQIISKATLQLHNQFKIDQSRKHLMQTKKLIQYSEGDLVFLLSPAHTGLNVSLKVSFYYTGPFYIKQMLSQTRATLSMLNNTDLPGQFHVNRLKPAQIRSPQTEKPTIKTITELRNQYSEEHILNLQKQAKFTEQQHLNNLTSDSSHQDTVPSTTQDYSYVLCDISTSQNPEFINTYQDQPHGQSVTNLKDCNDQIIFFSQPICPATITKARWHLGKLQYYISISSECLNYKPNSLCNWFTLENECYLQIIPNPKPKGSFTKFQRSFKC
jgi:hypothetical protein